MKGDDMAAVLSQVESALAEAACPPVVAPAAFRGAMGSFATGVTIVTACDAHGVPVGLTANSFNSVSLSPPLVLWSLAVAARSMMVFRHATHFTVNVLAADQRPLAERFASRVADRFEGLAHHAGLHGCPVIEGAAAVFECRSRNRHEEGDHMVFIGEVLRCSHRPDVQPLVYHQGAYVTGLLR